MNFPDGVRVSKRGSIQASGVACLPGQWGKKDQSQNCHSCPYNPWPYNEICS